RLSRFTADSIKMPSSSGVKTTSVGMSRIVEVMGAMMMPVSTSSAESRVSTRTGRRLSGGRNVYQRTSPRFTMLPPTSAHFARHQIHLVQADSVHNQRCAAAPTLQFPSVLTPSVRHRAKMQNGWYLNHARPYLLPLTTLHQWSFAP